MWIKRSGIIYITLVLMFTSIIFRCYYVTLGDVSEKTQAVAGNRSVKLELYTTKGVIYDRNLCALAGNQFAYYIVVNPRGFDREKIQYLADFTGTDVDTINTHLQKESVFVLKSYYKPDDIEGVYVYEGTTRYSELPTALHLLGYLDTEQKKGLSGVEKAFDDELSAYSTTTYIKYTPNALRGVIAGLGIVSQKDKEDTTNGIILTVDKKLSVALEQSMDKHIKEGAAVIMDCKSGDILALSSLPDFDINNISAYLNSSKGELINNALVNQTVGSVFKMIVATCAIQNNMEDFEYECNGAISIAGRTLSCQNQKKHGKMTLKEAFAQSCNSYFIALGQLLGYDKLVETAQLFGVDSSISISKNLSTASGTIPENEGILALANLTIGQGKLMMSPLQLARITAVMCNGGFLVNPTIYYGAYVDKTISSQSEYSYKSQIINSETAQKLKEMCMYCVSNGTGASAKPETGIAGGKTASAQTGVTDSSGEEILNTYFTGFYPADDPKYVITVFAKKGESGSKTCAPVFKEMCDYIAQNY